MTSSASPPISSSKVEDEPEYEENDDEYDDEDDYYAPPTKLTNNLEAKSSSKVPSESTTESTKKSHKNFNINTDLDSKTFSQNSPTQKQAAVIIKPDSGFKLTQTQNGKAVKYPLSEQLRDDKDPKLDTLENVPEGFNIETNKKEAIVDLTATQVGPKIKYSTRYLPSRVSDDDRNSITNQDKVQRPDSYVTVTKSLSGSLDENKNENGKFASTYYTKSSTCGFFTFSCNIVHGPNGKSKVCKPNKQTNPKC